MEKQNVPKIQNGVPVDSDRDCDGSHKKGNKKRLHCMEDCIVENSNVRISILFCQLKKTSNKLLGKM